MAFCFVEEEHGRKARIHVDRVAGSDRHHCDPGSAAFAGHEQTKGEGTEPGARRLHLDPPRPAKILALMNCARSCAA